MSEPNYHIKARQKGTRTFYFLKSGDGVTRLRIHAGQWRESYLCFALTSLKASNPDIEFKAVKIK